jgi:hypothetical protein
MPNAYIRHAYKLHIGKANVRVFDAVFGILRISPPRTVIKSKARSLLHNTEILAIFPGTDATDIAERLRKVSGGAKGAVL